MDARELATQSQSCANNELLSDAAARTLMWSRTGVNAYDMRIICTMSVGRQLIDARALRR